MPRNRGGKRQTRGRRGSNKEETGKRQTRGRRGSNKEETDKGGGLFPLLNMMNYFYINNVPPGMLVLCEKCINWRFVKEYQEECDVPQFFDCSMWHISDDEIGNCYIPQLQDDKEFTNERYTPGSLVWAKMDKFPWWPAMVEDDPRHLDISKLQYCKDLETNPQYHVVFFGEKVSRAWIKDKQLKTFAMKEMDGCKIKDLKKSIDDVIKAMNMKKDYRGPALKKSIEDAVEAMKMERNDRLLTYSFGARFRQNKIKKENKGSTSPTNQRTVRGDKRKRTTSNDKWEASAQGIRRSPRHSLAEIQEPLSPFMATLEDKNAPTNCWEVPQRKKTTSNDQSEAPAKRIRRSPKKSWAQIAESEKPFMAIEEDENSYTSRWEVPENNATESSAANLNYQHSIKEIGNFTIDENNNDKYHVSKAKRKSVEFQGSVEYILNLEAEDADNEDEVSSEEEKLSEEFLNTYYPRFALFKKRDAARYEDVQAEADKLFEDFLKKKIPIPLGF